jgi:UDP-glucose 4-epimerase
MVVPRFVTQALRGEAYGSVFNVGHTKGITMHDLARLVKEMTGSRSPIVLVPYDEAYQPGFEDMPRRMPDISRISALIGYSPRLSLHEMLEQTIAYYTVAAR